MNRLSPIHPGEVLREELIEPLGLDLASLAHALRLDPVRLQALVEERAILDAEIALRLARFFGLSPAFWLNLQLHFDLEAARDKLGDRVDREVRPFESGLPGW